MHETQNLIWDWQFKRFKNRVERERYRVEYDNLKHKTEAVEVQIKEQTEKPTMSKDERARLDDEKVRMAADIKKYEASMKQCDDDLHGTKPTMENPGGNPGIETMIDALRDLKEVYRAYTKSL